MQTAKKFAVFRDPGSTRLRTATKNAAGLNEQPDGAFIRYAARFMVATA